MPDQAPQTREIHIWLSASIPDEIGETSKREFENFIKALARHIFSKGGGAGTLWHGCQPEVTSLLVEAAEPSKRAPGEIPLGLVVSNAFVKDEPNNLGATARITSDQIQNWRQVCGAGLIQTPVANLDEQPDQTDDQFMMRKRAASLGIMRETLGGKANVFIAVGGRWANTNDAIAGVSKEIDVARSHGLPIFLLTAFGGSAEQYAKQNPEVWQTSYNGLNTDAYRKLSQESDGEELAKKVFEQIQNLPLRPREASAGRPYRILSLDGGGIRGAFTAAMLAQWEKQIAPRRILDHFDLVAGTSTGGLIALGLWCGMSAAAISKFYQEHGPRIFKPKPFTGWLDGKYDLESLRSALAKTPIARTEMRQSPAQASGSGFPASANDSQSDSAALRTIQERTRFVICAYDRKLREPRIYRTPHTSRTEFYEADLVDIALATAAAPVYFSPFRSRSNRLIDGGVWANNPTLVAVSEAVFGMGIDSTRLRVLSLGTTTSPGVDREGLMRRFWDLPGILMRAQGQGSELLSARILSQSRYTRVDRIAEEIGLAETAKLDKLSAMGSDTAQVSRRRSPKGFLQLKIDITVESSLPD